MTTPALPFRRERLTALAGLALPAPIPLLFTHSLEPIAFVLYAAALGLLLFRLRRGHTPALSNAVLNFAGIVGAFLFYADLRFGSRSLLRATVHLLLLVTVIRLWSVVRERDLGFGLGLVGFLFVGAVATSFHYAIAAYVVGFLVLAWPVLVRWALFRDLASAPDEWTRGAAGLRFPDPRAVATSVLAALVVAVPFFVALPRLRAPLITGLPERRELTTGFSETVDSDLYGTLKQSDRVYLRISRDPPFSERQGSMLQIRAIAFSTHDGRTWTLGKRSRLTPVGPAGQVLPLAPPRDSGLGNGPTMTIDLLPLNSRYVPVPTGSLSIELSEASFRTGGAYLEVDRLDNFVLAFPPERTIQYRTTGEGLAAPGRAPGPGDASRRPPGSPRIAAWARSVLGSLDPAQEPARAAAALSARLAASLTYSLEVWRPGPNPVEEFLFERRAGTCEQFATALALALREVGVPTRFVTGFAGGEIGLFGRYLIVRGRDAHAWVEVWCGPDQGWVVFDPTPPAGRPALQRVPWTRRLKQLSDAFEFFYDRNVLSFAQGDQLDLLQRLRAAAADTGEAVTGALRTLREAARAGGARVGALGVLAGVAGAFCAAILLVRVVRALPWMTRGLPPGSRAYRRLQRQLARRGSALTPASAPGETLAAARGFGPAVAGPAKEIVRLYLLESFAGQPLGPVEVEGLESGVREVRRGLRGGR